MPVENDKTGRRARWSFELDPYDWVVSYRPGVAHSNVDALSRIPNEFKEAEPDVQEEGPRTEVPQFRHMGIQTDDKVQSVNEGNLGSGSKLSVIHMVNQDTSDVNGVQQVNTGFEFALNAKDL